MASMLGNDRREGKRGLGAAIVAEVMDAVAAWPRFAAEVGLADAWTRQMQGAHRMAFPGR